MSASGEHCKVKIECEPPLKGLMAMDNSLSGGDFTASEDGSSVEGLIHYPFKGKDTLHVLCG